MHPSFDSDRTVGDDVLEGRIEGLATWIGEVEARVRTTELATADEAAARELRLALEIVANHDPDAEHKLADRVNVVAERLETLSSALASTASALAAKDGEIAELQRRLDEEAKRTDALATGRSAGGGADRDGLRRAIAELSARVEAIAEGDTARRRGLEELSARFETSDEHIGSLADDLQQRLETVAAGAQAPDDGLDALDERIAALELQAGTGADSYAEVAQVRTQLEGLRMRLASAERELAALSGSQRMVDRIDDVARRLAVIDPALERATAAYAPPIQTSRSGAELRALELRLEHAETTERETRLEFLSHLERLAQRIELRLGALDDSESDPDALPEAVGGAQVVSLHNPERP
ncbi:MAG: hypothetical protein R6W48_11755 [Gaiellaceae bacterium]